MKPPSEAPSIPRASRAQGHSRPSSKPLLDCDANTLSKRGVGNYAERLQHLADHPEQRAEMSEKALAKVQSFGGWQSYGDKAMPIYSALAGAGSNLGP
jgi:hypothetical protein